MLFFVMITWDMDGITVENSHLGMIEEDSNLKFISVEVKLQGFLAKSTSQGVLGFVG